MKLAKRNIVNVADPEPTDEFSLEGRNDHEISVRDRASGHVYKFAINGAGLAPEPTIVANPETPAVAESLKAAARRAALEYVEASSRMGPRPPDGWMPADGWMSGDDASNQVVIQQAETARRRFIFGEARGQAGAFGGAAGTLSGVAAEAKAGDLSSPPDIEAIIPPQARGGSQFAPAARSCFTWASTLWPSVETRA